MTPEIEFNPLQTSDKAWTWTAADYSEVEILIEPFEVSMITNAKIFSQGEIRNELLALKFKTPDLATNWIELIRECQNELKNKPAKTASQPETNGLPEATANGESKAEPVSLAQFAAAQKASSWECSQCLVRNDSSKIQCLSCESAKPGHEDEVKNLKEAAKPAAPVMTIGSGGGFKFGTGAEFEEEEEYDDDYDNGETVMFHQQAFLRQKDDKTGKQIDVYLFDIKS